MFVKFGKMTEAEFVKAKNELNKANGGQATLKDFKTYESKNQTKTVSELLNSLTK